MKYILLKTTTCYCHGRPSYFIQFHGTTMEHVERTMLFLPWYSKVKSQNHGRTNSFCKFYHCPFHLSYFGVSVICDRLSFLFLFFFPHLAFLLSHMLPSSSIPTRFFLPIPLFFSLREHLAGCRSGSGAGCSEDSGESRAVFIPDQQFSFLSAQCKYLLWPSNIL